jgi:hypothetical protein
VAIHPVTDRYLANLRDVAHSFPPAERVNLSWAVHRAAGNPEGLKVIVKTAPKDQTLTVQIVENTKKLIELAHEERRRRASAVAEKGLEEAEEELLAARTAAARATEDEEREVAVAQAGKAEKNLKKAKAKRSRHKRPPAKKQGSKALVPLPPGGPMGDALMIAEFMIFEGECRRIGKEIRERDKVFTPYLDRMSNEMVVECVEAVRKLFNEVRGFTAKFETRLARPKLGGHLTVVGDSSEPTPAPGTGWEPLTR